MTRQEAIEELQDKVSKQYILTLDKLEKATTETGYEDIEPISEVLSNMGWNICDRCGALGNGEQDFMWVEYFPFEDDNESDQHLLKAIKQEDEDYCALCWECVNEMKGEK